MLDDLAKMIIFIIIALVMIVMLYGILNQVVSIGSNIKTNSNLLVFSLSNINWGKFSDSSTQFLKIYNPNYFSVAYSIFAKNFNPINSEKYLTLINNGTEIIKSGETQMLNLTLTNNYMPEQTFSFDIIISCSEI